MTQGNNNKTDLGAAVELNKAEESDQQLLFIYLYIYSEHLWTVVVTSATCRHTVLCFQCKSICLRK